MVPVSEMQDEIEEAKRMERYIQLAGEHARDNRENRAYEDGYSERSNLSFTGNRSNEGSMFEDSKTSKADAESQQDSLEFDETEKESKKEGDVKETELEGAQ